MKHKYFKQFLTPFEGHYQERAELIDQIDTYLMYMGGLSQPCHCESESAHKECQEREKKIMVEVDKLKQSIKIALDL